MTAMRAAVLGANGFIGRRIVEMFHLNDLADVRPITHTLAGMAALSRFRLDCRAADAFDEQALAAAFAGCEAVIYSVAGDNRTILGTLGPVYRAAEKAGVKRLVYLSTASVHGQAPRTGTDEASPLSDRQPISYNNAKVRAEWKLWSLRDRGRVELVMLRPGIVFGPRSRWISGFADDLLAGQAYHIDGGGGICNSVYVDNLVQAVHLALKATQADGEAFLIGDQEEVTWADLYRPVANALGFDFAQVPEAVVPEFTPSRLDRLDRIRSSRPVQLCLSVFSRRVRMAGYLAYRHLTEPPVESPWELPVEARPAATLEMSLLYRCRYKFPLEKARRLLGYEPGVTFEEGCRRSIGWLAFAGYPVVDPHPDVRSNEPGRMEILR